MFCTKKSVFLKICVILLCTCVFMQVSDAQACTLCGAPENHDLVLKNYNGRLYRVTGAQKINIIRVTMDGRTTPDMAGLKSRTNSFIEFCDRCSYGGLKFTIQTAVDCPVPAGSSMGTTRTLMTQFSHTLPEAVLTIVQWPKGLATYSNAGQGHAMLMGTNYRDLVHEAGHILGFGHSNTNVDYLEFRSSADGSSYMSSFATWTYCIPQQHWIAWPKQHEVVKINDCLNAKGFVEVTLRPLAKGGVISDIPVAYGYDIPGTEDRLFIDIPKAVSDTTNGIGGGEIFIYRVRQCKGCTGMAMGTVVIGRMGNPRTGSPKEYHGVRIETMNEYESTIVKFDGQDVHNYKWVKLRFVLVDSNPPANIPPSVSITEPLDGQTFDANSDISIVAEAFDDNKITKFELYRDGILLNQSLAQENIFLPASQAVIHGTTAKYEPANGNIGFWTNINDWVSWTANVQRPSTFEVWANYACANSSAGATYRVEVGGQQVTGTVTGTGSGWTTYSKINLGTVDINQPGQIAVNVIPQTKPNSAVMNLKDVTLIPLADGNDVFEYVWPKVPAGTYTLTAKVFDNNDANTVSAPVVIDVRNTGDINGDQNIDNYDLKIMVENWLINNGYNRQVGQLIGKWDFNQGSGTAVIDGSGNSNTAVFHGDPNWVDGAIDLDGDGDYLQTGNNITRLQLEDAYSIALKLNAATVQTDWAAVLTKCDETGDHWSLGFGGGATSGKIVMFNGSTMWDTAITLDQIKGDWHDIVITFGGGFISSYLDGSLVNCEKFAALPVGGNGHLNIGCDRQQTNFYKGQLDDILIFNCELTSDEVKNVFKSSSDSPVGQWSFNDGTASDSSGNNKNATLMAGSTIIEDPQKGKVLNLNGSTAYVTVPTQTFSTVTDQVTIMLWQNGDQTQPQNDSVFSGLNGTYRNLNAHIPWGSQAVFWDAGCVGGSWDRITKAVEPQFYKGAWNHWAFTKDVTEGKMQIYLNGQLWHSETGKTKPMTGLTSFTISSSTSSYGGMIDDFSVYNYCLSDTEIQSIYETQALKNAESICHIYPDADLNRDCKVDYFDYVILAGNWLR